MRHRGTICCIMAVLGLALLTLSAAGAADQARLPGWKTLTIRDIRTGAPSTLENIANGRPLLLFVWTDDSPTCVQEFNEFWSLCAELKRTDPNLWNGLSAATIVYIKGGYDSPGGNAGKKHVWKLVSDGGIDLSILPVYLDYDGRFIQALFAGKRTVEIPLALHLSSDGSLLDDPWKIEGDSLRKWFRIRFGPPPVPDNEIVWPPPPDNIPVDSKASPYALQIAVVVGAKVMNVYDDGRFRPQDEMPARDWAKVLETLGGAARQIDNLKAPRDQGMTRARALVSLMRALLSSGETPRLAEGDKPLMQRIPWRECRDVEALEKLVAEQDPANGIRTFRAWSYEYIAHLRGVDDVPTWALPYYAKAYGLGLLDETPSLRASAPLKREYAAFLAAHFLPPRGDGYTGLVIDCRDYLMERSASPLIRAAPDGSRLQIYPFKPSETPTVSPAGGCGTVGYYSSLDEAKQGRGGKEPLVIPGADIDKLVESTPRRANSLVLKRDAIEKILRANEKSGFLQTWRVGFLVDQDELKVKPVYPEPNASDVALTEPLTVIINRVVTDGSKPEDASPICELTMRSPDGGEEPVPADVSYDRSTHLLQLTPRSQLQRASNYALYIRRAVSMPAQDARRRAALFEMTFTTTAKQTVTFKLPPGTPGELVLKDKLGQVQAHAKIGDDGRAVLAVGSGLYQWSAGTLSSYIQVPEDEAKEIDLTGPGTGGH